jgi:hypothetical protein
MKNSAIILATFVVSAVALTLQAGPVELIFQDLIDKYSTFDAWTRTATTSSSHLCPYLKRTGYFIGLGGGNPFFNLQMWTNHKDPFIPMGNPNVHNVTSILEVKNNDVADLEVRFFWYDPDKNQEHSEGEEVISPGQIATRYATSYYFQDQWDEGIKDLDISDLVGRWKVEVGPAAAKH